MVVAMPKAGEINSTLLADFEFVKEIIAGVRTVRLDKNIPNKEALTLVVTGEGHNDAYNSVIAKMCNLESIAHGEKDATAATYMVGVTEYSVPLGSNINVEEEIKKMEAEIEYLKGFLNSVMKKLGNEKFVANAKPEIVENERKKQADAESKIKSLQESIDNLRKA